MRKKNLIAPILIVFGLLALFYIDIHLLYCIDSQSKSISDVYRARDRERECQQELLECQSQGHGIDMNEVQEKIINDESAKETSEEKNNCLDDCKLDNGSDLESTALPKEVISTIKNKFPKWLAFWQKIAPGFNLDLFISGGASDINVDWEMPYDKQLTELEKRFYPFSPDGNKFIDPYSGLASLSEENGKIKVTFLPGDPDSQVGLIDLPTKTYKRILSCGTTCTFDFSFLLDDNVFIVLGSSEDSEMNKIPVIYLFDLSTNKVKGFRNGIVVDYEEFWNNYSLKDLLN